MSGIFEGVDVGGSVRKPPQHNHTNTVPSGYRRSRNRGQDSFAVNPQNLTGQNTEPKRQRVQTRADMIPNVNTGLAEKAAPEVPPVEAQPAANATAASADSDTSSEIANVIARSTQNATQSTSGQASPQYYKYLIGEVKGQSNTAAHDAARSGSKYTVSEKDKF